MHKRTGPPQFAFTLWALCKERVQVDEMPWTKTEIAQPEVSKAVSVSEQSSQLRTVFTAAANLLL
jgi:hypothetical protein